MNRRSEFRDAIDQLPREDPPAPTNMATAAHGGTAIAGNHVEIHMIQQPRTSASMGVHCQVGVAGGVFMALLMAWLLGVPMQGMPLYITVWIGFLTGLATGIAVWRKDRASDI